MPVLIRTAREVVQDVVSIRAGRLDEEDTMKLNTRFTTLVGVTMVGAVALTACGDANDGADDDVQLRFYWWGSDTRVQLTNEIIEEFEDQHPNISIEAEYADWDGYWDQLATQAAGGDEPDIIQMDDAYLREYADRGSLLDLSDVDVSEFDEDVLDNTRTEEGLFGITTGINAAALVANPAVFEEAGVEMPDDTTWTWDDLEEIAAEISENHDSAFGLSEPAETGGFQTWLRQQDQHLTTDDGELGFEADDAVEYFEYYLGMVGEGLPTAAEMAENQPEGPDESFTGTGQVAMSFWWTNELPALSSAADEDLELLRYPSSSGESSDNGMWYKSSQMLSASASTDHPEEAQEFIEFFVNSEEAGEIGQLERGVPANNEVLDAIEDVLEPADERVAEFIDDIEADVEEHPSEPVPSIGFSALQEILYRYETEVFFENLTPEDAAEQMINEMEQELS